MLIREMTEYEKLERNNIGKKVKELQDKNLCPSCYNFKHGDIYQYYSNRLLYEDDILWCFLEQYPRNAGHTIILIKEHYEDLSEIPLDIANKVMKLSKVVTNAMKEIINAKKVYMCTMCDGKRNHLHFQLIPRDENSITGSKVFVKPRGIFVEDKDIINKLKLYITKNMYDN